MTVCCILVSHPPPHTFWGPIIVYFIDLMVSHSLHIDAGDLHVDLLLSILQNS